MLIFGVILSRQLLSCYALLTNSCYDSKCSMHGTSSKFSFQLENLDVIFEFFLGMPTLVAVTNQVKVVKIKKLYGLGFYAIMNYFPGPIPDY